MDLLTEAIIQINPKIFDRGSRYCEYFRQRISESICDKHHKVVIKNKNILIGEKKNSAPHLNTHLLEYCLDKGQIAFHLSNNEFTILMEKPYEDTQA